MARRSVVSFLRAAIASLGGAAAVLGGSGIRAALAALPAGSAVALVMAASVASREGIWPPRLRLDFPRSRRLFSEALPYALHGGVLVLVLRFDVVVLSVLSTRSETAQYDIAARVVDALSYIGTVVASPSLFLLSRRFGSGDSAGAGRAFDGAVRAAYLAGLPLAAGLVALHRPAVDLLFGTGYQDAALPLAILGGQIWLFFLAGVQGSLVLAAGLAVPALRVSLVHLVVIVVLDLALIPFFGAVGAAVATAIAQAAATLLMAAFTRRRLGLRTLLPSARMVLAAVATGVVAALAGDRWLPLGVVAGAGTYVAVLFATGELRRLEISRIMRSLHKS
jgi:O-antigen/teichoic acid export membrane protein